MTFFRLVLLVIFLSLLASCTPTLQTTSSNASVEVTATFFDGDPQTTGLVREAEVLERTTLAASRIARGFDDLDQAEYVQVTFPSWNTTATFDLLDGDDVVDCEQRLATDIAFNPSFAADLRLDVNERDCRIATTLEDVLEDYASNVRNQVSVALFSEGDITEGAVTGVYTFDRDTLPNIGISTRTSYVYLNIPQNPELTGSYRVRGVTPRSLGHVEIVSQDGSSVRLRQLLTGVPIN
jgi:hypothetical protein